MDLQLVRRDSSFINIVCTSGEFIKALSSPGVVETIWIQQPVYAYYEYKGHLFAAHLLYKLGVLSSRHMLSHVETGSIAVNNEGKGYTTRVEALTALKKRLSDKTGEKLTEGSRKFLRIYHPGNSRAYDVRALIILNIL